MFVHGHFLSLSATPAAARNVTVFTPPTASALRAIADAPSRQISFSIFSPPRHSRRRFERDEVQYTFGLENGIAAIATGPPASAGAASQQLGRRLRKRAGHGNSDVSPGVDNMPGTPPPRLRDSGSNHARPYSARLGERQLSRTEMAGQAVQSEEMEDVNGEEELPAGADAKVEEEGTMEAAKSSRSESELAKEGVRLRVFKMEELDLHNRERVLGEGGFSDVFKATIISGRDAGHEVVVKALDMSRAKVTQGNIELYMNHKVQQDASLYMPKFVGFHKSVGNFFMVWRLEGEITLEQILLVDGWFEGLEAVVLGDDASDRGSLVERKYRLITRVMADILRGLEHIHSYGIVHRDVKPSNVVVTDDGVLKLIDFGCAVDLRNNVGYVPKEAPGTREYLPPEWRVRPDSPASFDMFGVGMILLQLVFPSMRTTPVLDRFRSDLKASHSSVERWMVRKLESADVRRSMMEPLQVLQYNDRALWRLLCGLLHPKYSQRTTLHQALQIVDPPSIPVTMTTTAAGAAVQTGTSTAPNTVDSLESEREAPSIRAEHKCTVDDSSPTSIPLSALDVVVPAS